jgi:hypothetical protein
MQYGSFQYKLQTSISEHEIGVEYLADGEYVELKDITLHESHYFGGVYNKSRYMQDIVIKKLKQKHIDDIYAKAVTINDGECNV